MTKKKRTVCFGQDLWLISLFLKGQNNVKARFLVYREYSIFVGNLIYLKSHYISKKFASHLETIFQMTLKMLHLLKKYLSMLLWFCSDFKM